MKKLFEFKEQILSRSEMNAVKGGKMYSCNCGGSGEGCNVGSWEGNYSSVSQVSNAINTWCTCGGICAGMAE